MKVIIQMRVIIIFNSILTNEGDNNIVIVIVIAMQLICSDSHCTDWHGPTVVIFCDDLCFSYKLQNELNKF